MEPIRKKKRRFQIEKLEERIAPDLTLVGVPGAAAAPAPLAFAGFDTPAPGYYHPNFYRSPTAVATTDALAGTNPTVQNPGFGNEGPWSAHYVSDVIDCADPTCP